VLFCVQVWLAIFQLLLSEETRSKYEISSFRKNTLLKVKYYLFVSVVLFFASRLFQLFTGSLKIKYHTRQYAIFLQSLA